MRPLDRELKFINRTLPLARAALGPAQDLLKIAQQDLCDETRLKAAERVARHIPRPIHPKRWPRIAEALDGSQFDLHSGVRSALFACVPDILRPKSLGEEGLTLRQVWVLLRRQVDRQLTMDLFGGADACRKFVPLDQAPEPSCAPPEDEILSTEAVLCLLSAARLSARERQLALALAAGEGVLQAANRFGIQPSTARVLVHRIRKKFGRM